LLQVSCGYHIQIYLYNLFLWIDVTPNYKRISRLRPVKYIRVNLFLLAYEDIIHVDIKKSKILYMCDFYEPQSEDILYMCDFYKPQSDFSRQSGGLRRPVQTFYQIKSFTFPFYYPYKIMKYFVCGLSNGFYV
jgi:hypothetical protein